MTAVELAAILVRRGSLASVVSVEIISVALIELVLGVALGNVFNLDPNAGWLVFIASFASVVLTFLAGAEVDPDDFRERFRRVDRDRLVSFAGPFVVATPGSARSARMDDEASLIAGTALSTTSLAVVYAVLVETGLNTVRRKLIMSACFVTDMCTVIALSVIFIKPTIWFPGLSRRVGRADRAVAEALALVLRPLRRPRDRARDQARLRDPARADGPRQRGQQPGGAAGVRARPRDVAPLPAPPGGAAAPARRRVRVPDAVLLPARRHERLLAAVLANVGVPAVLVARR